MSVHGQRTHSTAAGASNTVVPCGQKRNFRVHAGSTNRSTGTHAEDKHRKNDDGNDRSKHRKNDDGDDRKNDDGSDRKNDDDNDRKNNPVDHICTSNGCDGSEEDCATASAGSMMDENSKADIFDPSADTESETKTNPNTFDNGKLDSCPHASNDDGLFVDKCCHQFDNILFFFKFMYFKIHGLYGSDNLRAYKQA